MLLTLNTVMQGRAATLLRPRLHFGFLSPYKTVLHDSPWNFLGIFVFSALKDSKKLTFLKKIFYDLVFWLLTVQLAILTNVLRWRLHDDVFYATLSCFSHVWLFATLQTVAHQTPPSTGFSRQLLLWTAIAFSRGPSQPSDRIHVSCLLNWQAGYH